jgi:AcrR family transcriptional regulator
MKPAVRYKRASAETIRRKILRRAVDIASAEGLEGLSIGGLAEAMRMSKSGIFAHFGSKKELQLATVETAKDIFTQLVVAPAMGKARGVERLQAMLENWLRYVEKGVFSGGCFFFAASAEFDSRRGAVRNRIAELMQNWLRGLEHEIAYARKGGELASSIQPAQLAFELHACVQEANWAFKLFEEKSAIRLARRAIAERIADAGAAGRRRS